MANKKIKIKTKAKPKQDGIVYNGKKLPKAPVVVSLPMNGITFKLKGQPK